MAMRSTGDATEGALPRRSPTLLRLFAPYARRYVQRKFNAVRLLRDEGAGAPMGADDGAAAVAEGIVHLPGPVVFHANHPAWWDPLVLILLATQQFGERNHYAPIDAAMLRKYAFFKRLGFFGIEKEGRRGAARFIRAGRAIVTSPESALWVTPQGRFADVRDRPVTLEPGLAHLARWMKKGWVVPVAIEYVFWQESTPEALLALGEPVDVAAHRDWDVAAWQHALERGLEATMDRLAAASRERDGSRFHTMVAGRRGVGGVYDLWRRVKASARGQPFEASHEARGADTKVRQA